MQTKLTSDLLSKMKLIPNKVLVKPTFDQHNLQLAPGLKIKIDSQYAQEKHAPTTGIVYNVCGELISENMPWHTHNEVAVGDYAVYSYESAIFSTDEDKGRFFLDENNSLYLLLDYEDLFVVRRNDLIVPVNGYLLVSPMPDETFATFTLDTTKKNSTKWGKVEYVGARNECYYAAGKVRTDTYDFKDEVKVGDVICFETNSDLPVEYEIHHTIKEKQEYFRLQRRDILHVL